MAERAPKNFGADPLNLMRVIPPKGEGSWPCVLHRMAFLFELGKQEFRNI